MRKTDILIIGTGIAGLSFAVKTASKRKDLSITIMTKEKAEVSNTLHAQGGIAAVMDNLRDSFDQHINDTLKSGGGESDPKIVKMVVYQAPERLQELIDLGMAFDKNKSDWDLALEGGHSQPRILHHKDNTGFEIEKTLLEAVKRFENITILEHHYVADLVTETDNCVGAWYFDDENVVRYIRAKVTVVSTGGCGQIFKNTTNSPIATGDGVAIAHRAKAQIQDMHYMQFHPTAMYEPDRNPSFLLSEALRGAGAHVVNENGRRFLFSYDINGELATRDIVSKAIVEELRKSGQKHAYLDCTHLNIQKLQTHFESIYNYCKSKGINPSKHRIPIIPVAHYQCGGITVNQHSQTTVNDLYAIGECARTGLHGKNRLASNSLLEALVFAHQASVKVCDTIDDISHSTTIYVNKFPVGSVAASTKKIDELKDNLKSVLEQYHIDSAINKALLDIQHLKEIADSIFQTESISKPITELINMLTVATLIVEHSKNNELVTF
ncbi:MAG: L-aspartate oxidase [Flavobacterium sp.]|nr:L-aspartate oxidase [Flavobacterium sp.]